MPRPARAQDPSADRRHDWAVGRPLTLEDFKPGRSDLSPDYIYDKVDPDSISAARFAFIIHPRTLEDIRRNFPRTGGFSDRDLAAIANRSNAVLVGQVQNDRGSDGVYISAVFDPMLMGGARPRNVRLCRSKILGAARRARELGIRWIGLGGLSAHLTRYGLALPKLEGLATTTGHALTAWTLEKNVEQARTLLGAARPRVAVVGAAGSVGLLLARRLVAAGHHVHLVDLPNQETTLRAFCGTYTNLRQSISYGTVLDRMCGASIAVFVTNSARYVIERVEDIRPGMIVIDDAQPWAWDHFGAYERFRRQRDILPLEGGLLTTRDGSIRSQIDTINVQESDFFCCLGEVCLLANDPDTLSPVMGKNRLQNLEERLIVSSQYGEAATEAGIVPARFQCADHIYTGLELDEFRLEVVRSRL